MRKIRMISKNDGVVCGFFEKISSQRWVMTRVTHCRFWVLHSILFSPIDFHYHHINSYYCNTNIDYNNYYDV